MTTITAKHISLGAKFRGSCAVCGDACTDLAKTSLYRTADGFVVVHPACAGGSTKNAVSGGAKYRTQPKATIQIEA